MTSSVRAINPFYATRIQGAARHQLPPGPPRFPLGQIIFSASATLRLRTEEVLTALGRHGRGDWGDLLPEDALANALALQQGGRLFSAYGLGHNRFWIITDADRSRTTVLLPEDA
jgi:hypothetical protein